MTRPLPVRHSPRPVRALALRFLGSTSLRGSVRAAYTPAVMCALFVLTVFVTLATRGEAWIAGDWQPIPTEAGSR